MFKTNCISYSFKSKIFDVSNYITKEEILKFQQEWGQKVVEIGNHFHKKTNYIKVAYEFVESFYAYHEGIVLFKPTRACKKQFRTTYEGAVSYFIGSNKNFPEDEGFALQPWIKVRFENNGFILDNPNAVSMGNYYFTNVKGLDTKVEYTIGYVRTQSGQIKINLHHSSLPYPK